MKNQSVSHIFNTDQLDISTAGFVKPVEPSEAD